MNLLLSGNSIIRCLEVIWSVRLNTAENIDAWILVDKLPTEEIDLSDYQIHLNLVDVSSLNISKSKLLDFTPEVFSQMVYGRLFMTKFLPEDITKILYLDTDVMVCKNIDQLYQMDISRVYAAAARDISIELFAKHELQRTKVEYYFNSGVLLLNIKKIKEDLVDQKIVNFYLNPPSEFIEDITRTKLSWWHDQTILNMFFSGKIKFIDPKFNVQSILFGYPQYDQYAREFGHRDLNNLIQNCVISHAQGGAKPWKFEEFLHWQEWQLPYRIWQFDVWNSVRKNLVKQFQQLKKFYTI